MVEAGIVFGSGVSSPVGGVVDVAAGVALDGCTIGGLLQLGGESAFFLLEPFHGIRDFLNFALD